MPEGHGSFVTAGDTEYSSIVGFNRRTRFSDHRMATSRFLAKSSLSYALNHSTYTLWGDRPRVLMFAGIVLRNTVIEEPYPELPSVAWYFFVCLKHSCTIAELALCLDERET